MWSAWVPWSSPANHCEAGVLQSRSRSCILDEPGAEAEPAVDLVKCSDLEGATTEELSCVLVEVTDRSNYLMSASSYWQQYYPELAADGILGVADTRWHAGNQVADAWLQADMRSAFYVMKVHIEERRDGTFNQRSRNTEIHVGSVDMNNGGIQSSNALCMKQPDTGSFNTWVYDCDGAPLLGQYVLYYKEEQYKLCNSNCVHVQELVVFISELS